MAYQVFLWYLLSHLHGNRSANIRNAPPVRNASDAALSELHNVLGQRPGFVAEHMRYLRAESNPRPQPTTPAKRNETKTKKKPRKQKIRATVSHEDSAEIFVGEISRDTKK